MGTFGSRSSQDTRLINGRYKVIGPIRKGGFGRVQRALDRRLGRDVAIKWLERVEEDPAQDPVDKDEAAHLAKLDHPAIVKLFDEDRDERGKRFLVMEFLKGEPLDCAIEGNTRRFTYPYAARLMLELVDAVAHMHDRDIVHHDLKPANIILEPEPSGRVRIADFGLSVARFSQPRRRPRRTWRLRGTKEYVAPEVWGGPVRCEEGKVDIWALGVILYQLLADRLPFPGVANTDDPHAALVMLRRAPPPPPTPDRLSAALWDVCLCCLQKSPRERPTARELGELVSAALRQNAEAAGGSTQAPPIAWTARVPSPNYVDHVMDRLGRLAEWEGGRGYTELSKALVHIVSNVQNPDDVALTFVRVLRKVAQPRISDPPDAHAKRAAKLAFDVLEALSDRGFEPSTEQQATAGGLFDFWWRRDPAVAAFLFRLYGLGDDRRKRRLDTAFVKLLATERSVPLGKFVQASGTEHNKDAVAWAEQCWAREIRRRRRFHRGGQAGSGIPASELGRAIGL